jgi:hypothetical protein
MKVEMEKIKKQIKDQKQKVENEKFVNKKFIHIKSRFLGSPTFDNYNHTNPTSDRLVTNTNINALKEMTFPSILTPQPQACHINYQLQAIDKNILDKNIKINNCDANFKLMVKKYNNKSTEKIEKDSQISPIFKSKFSIKIENKFNKTTVEFFSKSDFYY